MCFRFEWEQELRSRYAAERGRPVPQEMAIGLLLATYGNADGTSIFPTQARMRDQLGYARTSLKPIVDGIRNLRESGWIHEIKKGNQVEGPSRYRLIIPPC